jgi:hypothetical protein
MKVLFCAVLTSTQLSLSKPTYYNLPEDPRERSPGGTTKMKVEVRRSKKEELPPYTVIIAFKEFRGIVGAEKVFYEGKEVQEERDFNDIYKVEIVEEEGLEEDRYGYERRPKLYIYLWGEKQ